MSEGMIVRRGGGSRSSAASQGVLPNEINFYDYDGSLLYSFAIYEMQDMDELPEGPDHTDDGLIFDGWNWTLEQLQEVTMPTDVGALYDTTPYTFTYNSTEMTLSSPAVVKFYTTSVGAVTVYYNATGVTYWQIDNRTVVKQSSSGNISLTWNTSNSTGSDWVPTVGYHVFRIIPAEGVTITLGQTNNKLFNSYSSHHVFEVACGKKCTGFGSQCFYGAEYISRIASPNPASFSMPTQTFYNPYTPFVFIVPTNITAASLSNANRFVWNGNYRQFIVFPKLPSGVTNMSVSSMSLGRNSNRIIVLDVASLAIDSALSHTDRNIHKVYFHSMTCPTFNSTSINSIAKFLGNDSTYPANDLIVYYPVGATGYSKSVIGVGNIKLQEYTP